MRGGIVTFLRHRIDPLLETIEQQRRVVDAGLTHPGSWRGPIRREFTKGTAPKQRARVAAAFDHLVGLAGGGYIEITLACCWTCTPGARPRVASYRDREVKVGPFLTTAPFRRVSQLVEKAFDRAHDGVEPPLLAATRLHMELLLIHPLRDGNGRAVRLVIAAMLLNAGYKSTLFTAVEQHSHIDPPRYGKSFTPLRAGRPTQHEPWLYSALDLMAQSSGQAARYRSHETALRTILQGVKLRPALARPSDARPRPGTPTPAPGRQPSPSFAPMDRSHVPDDPGGAIGSPLASGTATGRRSRRAEPSMIAAVVHRQ